MVECNVLCVLCIWTWFWWGRCFWSNQSKLGFCFFLLKEMKSDGQCLISQRKVMFTFLAWAFQTCRVNIPFFHQAHFRCSLASLHCMLFQFSSVQFSPLTDWVIGGTWQTIRHRSSSSLSAGGWREQFWHGQGCPSFDVLYSAFPLLTTALPTLQGALKHSFWGAVVVCDMPEPC